MTCIQNRHVIFGASKVKVIPSLVRSFTQKKWLVMAFRDTADFVKDILRELSEQNISYIVDASLHHEPETTDIDRTAKLARDNGCGAVLAIGGGSVMDAAKAVAMLVTNPGTVVDYQMKGKVVENPTVPLIAVPTTSGTGSEATKVSVVYNPDNGLKKSFYSPYMIADTVILDPEITATLPERVTVSTGVDALSHAIESYVSLNATPYEGSYRFRGQRRNARAYGLRST